MTQRWLKLDERFPFTQTPIRLREKFGNEGLLVWVCMLTAAKRGTPEGTIEYVNEDHFWTKLGLHHSRPSFTSTEFLRYTGQLHLTRKRRSGDVETTEIRAWHDWQAEWRRDDDRERKSRKRRESEADTLRTRNGHPADAKRTETETETETENYPPNPPRGEVQEIYAHWRKARGKTNGRYDQLSPGRRKKIESRLREFSADELHRAIDAVARDPWPDRSLHDDLTVLFRSQEQVDKFLSLERKQTSPPCPECGIGGGTHLAECPVGHEQKARLR